MKLAFKPDADEARQRMRAFWAGEVLDRAPALIQTAKTGRTPRRRSTITAPDFDFQHDLNVFEEWAADTFFGGEWMPQYMPNYGPDAWAAYIGAQMTLVPEMNTSWIVPLIDDWEKFPQLSIAPDNKWWRATVELTKQAAARGVGKFLVSTIDTHSNLDCLSAARGPATLCMDLIEQPDAVLRAVRQMDALYQPVYDTLYEAGRMAETGTTSWLAMYSEKRGGATQCDFAYMISPEHFRQFVLPSLEFEIGFLEHAVYHMDGVGQIPHLDDLLAIRNLHTIQWVPGAGQPTAPTWLEMLQKIQKAGKAVQVFVSPAELKAIYRQLSPAKTHYWVVDCTTENEGRELLDWMKRNT